MAFVMVLSYSRAVFLRFFLDAQMANFLRSRHVAAFETWNDLPRVLLYDNLKSAVIERQGEAIRFHPTLLALAAHYRFEPRPVAVARGNEKGRVERAIRSIRDAFFAARAWCDLADLNAQAAAWCAGQAAARGENFGSITAALLGLLDSYGASELIAAIDEALAREVPHPHALSLGPATATRATRSANGWARRPSPAISPIRRCSLGTPCWVPALATGSMRSPAPMATMPCAIA
jgi:hypothetical protein